MRVPSRSSGFTLVEVIATLLIAMVLTTLAAPSGLALVSSLRSRAALDRLVADLYLARMLAVREGQPVELVLRRDHHRCVRGYLIRARGADVPFRTAELGVLGDRLCLEATGGENDSTVVYNSRGHLLPPTRSFFLTGRPDTVRLSIAGRIRRTY